MQECHFILVRLHKDAYNDTNNDQKGKKSDTIDSTTQNKESHAMKMILGPGTPKISTIEKKFQNHDRKSMG